MGIPHWEVYSDTQRYGAAICALGPDSRPQSGAALRGQEESLQLKQRSRHSKSTRYICYFLIYQKWM